ncbi:NAD(P)-dependent alcohol dehydrogenase [soil metagenome]
MISSVTRATHGIGKPFERTIVERRDVGEFDVLIDIAFAGICHSDIHSALDEWGFHPSFPFVPGHEIAGTVREVGPGVSRFGVGDRVGVGCFVDSCRVCGPCVAGEEQYCVEMPIFTYGAVGKDGLTTYGGYSDQIVVDENYVVTIPDSIPLDVAAPLLCAGITMYSPLRHWNAGPGTQVAVVGLGGLGHVGVKIAVAMGAEVTVISQSLSKKDDSLRMGAVDHRATSDPTTFDDLAGTFDLIVSTISSTVDLGSYLGMLRLDGAMVNVGLPEEPFSVPPFALTSRRVSLAGSNIGGIRETQEMLDFCGEHGIGADIELIDADGIDDAYGRVLASDVRYRFVIDASTIT